MNLEMVKPGPVCRLCALANALAHAKSRDAAMIASYVGRTDELDGAMVRFAFAYTICGPLKRECGICWWGTL